MGERILTIENHGPLLISTNFWESEFERRGLFFLSSNAGAFRLLVPRSQEACVSEMRGAQVVTIADGKDSAERVRALELCFEDGTDSPYVITIAVEQCDRLPLSSDQGREWTFSAWTAPRRGKPHKAFERPAYYRLVATVPWMRPPQTPLWSVVRDSTGEWSTVSTRELAPPAPESGLRIVHWDGARWALPTPNTPGKSADTR